MTSPVDADDATPIAITSRSSTTTAAGESCASGMAAASEAYDIGSGFGSHRQGIMEALERCADDDERYWFIQTLYNVLRETRQEAAIKERETWKRAAREGRLKIRSRKGVKFAEILPEILASELTD